MAGSAAQPRSNGFNGLRVTLALGIIVFHAFTLAKGSAQGMTWPLQAVAQLILPAFFSLSGYLVSGSLARASSLGAFIGLRLLRLAPALVAVIAVTDLVLGPILGSQPLSDYFTSAQTWRYSANIIGQPQYFLPGLFMNNPRPGVVNGVFWTIPLEVECYLGLAIVGVFARGFLRLGLLFVIAALLVTPATSPIFPASDLLLAFVCGAALQYAFVRISPLAGCACFALAFRLSCIGWHSALVFPLAGAVASLDNLPLPNLSGDYSYGLYLVGFPVEQAFLRVLPGLSWLTLLCLAAPTSAVLAFCLWHGVENPVLRRRYELLARAKLKIANLKRSRPARSLTNVRASQSTA